MGLNKCPGVGVTGVLNNIFRRSDFHQFAPVNNGNPVTQVPGGRETVGNKKKGDVQFFPYVRQNVKNMNCN